MTIQVPPDPLQSPVWDAMVENHLAGFPIVFDPAVEIGLPPVTEDQTQVPITIDARKLGPVDEVVVLGDLNPFPLTLKVRPKDTAAYFAFRMRIEQGTVIRAAARKNGQWHVGSRYLDAAGGGCSAPPVAESRVDWDLVGQIRARAWRESRDVLRLRVRIVHPMDTGLHKEPAFFIENLAIRDAKGARLADLDVKEPVAQNPVFTILVADTRGGDSLSISARDTDGKTYDGRVSIGPELHASNAYREGRL